MCRRELSGSSELRTQALVEMRQENVSGEASSGQQSGVARGATAQGLAGAPNVKLVKVELQTVAAVNVVDKDEALAGDEIETEKRKDEEVLVVVLWKESDGGKGKRRRGSVRDA